jgi:DNA-binding transcriptional LysR family regulator
MDFNLRVLRYLIAIVDEGQFARAAAKLFVTPPALTQQIRRLERDVGFELLDRSARPVVPTAAGAGFLREVRIMLEAADRASLVVDSCSRRTSGQYALGFVATPMGRLTRRLVEEFGARSERDNLRLVELGIIEQTEAVASGRVDASLVWGPTSGEGLHLGPALYPGRVLAVAADHALASLPRIGINQTNNETFISLSIEAVGNESYARWWVVDPRPDGSAVRYGTPVQTMLELVEEVAAGRGAAITSELIADTYPRPDVAYVAIEDIEPAQLLLCTRPEDTSPQTRLLRQIIREFHEHDSGAASGVDQTPELGDEL